MLFLCRCNETETINRHRESIQPPLPVKPLSPNSIDYTLERIEPFEPLADEERQRLEQLWDTGDLRRHLTSLESFFHQKQEELQTLVAAESDSSHLTEYAKLLVVENIVVDQITETRDQIQAIESEIWIQGELGNHDRDRIACEWSDHYAKAWRQWRLKEYLYAIDQMDLSPFASAQEASRAG